MIIRINFSMVTTNLTRGDVQLNIWLSFPHIFAAKLLTNESNVIPLS